MKSSEFSTIKLGQQDCFLDIGSGIVVHCVRTIIFSPVQESENSSSTFYTLICRYFFKLLCGFNVGHQNYDLQQTPPRAEKVLPPIKQPHSGFFKTPLFTKLEMTLCRECRGISAPLFNFEAIPHGTWGGGSTIVATWGEFISMILVRIEEIRIQFYFYWTPIASVVVNFQ